MSRIVYENNKIDYDLVIPEGTSEFIKEPISNLELMENGKAPYIKCYDENGNVKYVQVELHHMSGRETNRGHSFFGSEYSDGTIIELTRTDHKKYHRIIHITYKKGSSFRKDINTKGKSFDGKKYDKFRERYWKNRARKIKENMGIK